MILKTSNDQDIISEAKIKRNSHFQFISRVFEGLNITQNWTGDALFLEDDHYVSPDILHVLRLLRKMADRKPNVHFLSVGNYLEASGSFDVRMIVRNSTGVCGILQVMKTHIHNH